MRRIALRTLKVGFTLALAAALLVVLEPRQASAILCSTVITFTSGNGSITDAQAAGGACVLAQDKFYSGFALGNLPTGGTIQFTLNTIGTIDFHQIAFDNGYQAGTTYTGLSFQVAIFPPGSVARIIALDADFTQTAAGPSTLTKSSNPAGVGNPIVETKNGTIVTFCSHPLPGGVCGETYLPGVTSIVVSESLVDAGTISSITDTIVEQTVPEPASLLLLGSALIGFGIYRRYRKPS